MLDQYVELNDLILNAQAEQIGIEAYSGGSSVNHAQKELGEYMVEQGLTIVSQLRSAENTRSWIEQLRLMTAMKTKTTTGLLQAFLFDLVDYLDHALEQ